MASQKISQFTAITTLASGDYFPVVQASGTSNRRVEVGVFDARYTSLASGTAAQTTANTAQTTANTALASGNAALTDLSSKYNVTGGPITGTVTAQSQTIGTSRYINSSGTCILNFGAGNNFEVVLTNTSLFGVPVNASGGQTGTIILRQDSVGSRLLTYSGAWSFPSNTAPTLTTTASGVDLLAFYVVNSNRINAVATLNFGSGTVG